MRGVFIMEKQTVEIVKEKQLTVMGIVEESFGDVSEHIVVKIGRYQVGVTIGLN
jgi:hypothetical protein